MPLKEANVPEHRWYQKRYNARLARDDYSKDWIYPSGLRRIDEAFMRAEGYMVSNHVPKTMADFKNGVYVVDGIQTTFSAAFQHTATSNATMTGGYGEELAGDLPTPTITDVGGSVGTWDADTKTMKNTVVGTNSGYPRYKFDLGLEADKTYEIAVRFSGDYANISLIRMGTSGDDVLLDPSAMSSYFVGHGVADDEFLTIAIDGRFTAPITIESISVREAPKVQWRPHNLLTYSEDFSNAAWSKTDTTVTANAATAPDGTLTADEISHTSTSAQVSQAAASTDGVSYTVGIYVKYVDHQWFRIFADIGSVWFDIQNGVVGSTDASLTGALTDIGSGWYYLTIEDVLASGTSFTVIPLLASADLSTGETVGTSAYIWGAHLYRNDLGGMADVPATERVLPALTKYVRTAGRVIGEDLVTNGDFSDHADELVSDGTFDARGDELVANGDFSQGLADWATSGSGVTTSGAMLSLDGTSGLSLVWQDILTQNKVYELTFSADIFDGKIEVINNDGTEYTPDITASGVYSFTFTHTIPSGNLLFRVPSGDNSATIDNISVREVLADWSSYNYQGHEVTASIENGGIRVDNDATNGGVAAAYQVVTTEIGKTYEVGFDLVDASAASPKVMIRTSLSSSSIEEMDILTGAGSYSIVFTATATSTYIIMSGDTTAVGVYATWDNISVKEAVPGWSASNSKISVVDGRARVEISPADGLGYMGQQIAVTPGNVYRCTFNMANPSGPVNNAGVRIGTTQSGNELGQAWLDADATTGEVTFSPSSAETVWITAALSFDADNDYIDFDNIKVEEVDVDPSSARYMARIGHHVFNGQQWVNEGLELESGARTNLVPYSDFSSGWTAGGATLTAANSSGLDGNTSAATLIENTSTTQHKLQSSVAVSSGVTYTWSLVIKANGRSNFSLYPQSGTSASAVFDLDAVTSTDDITTNLNGHGVHLIAPDKYLCWITFTTTGTTVLPHLYLKNSAAAASAPSYTGDGSSGLIIEATQLEAGSKPSSLIPTSGSTVTRAAETLVQTGDKAPWPTAVYATNDELVTNGGFDTDTDWTKGTGWTIGSGVASCSGATNSALYQDASFTQGSVYEITFTVTSVTSGKFRFEFDSDDDTTTYYSTVGTYTKVFSPNSSTTNRPLFRTDATSGFNGSIDNISVKEIHRRAIGIQMHGYMTYADVTSPDVVFYRWFKDGSNQIKTQEVNSGGDIQFVQEANNVFDSVAGTSVFSPGINVPFKIASRHLDNAVQGAADGTTTTENTSPPGLPDLETTDLEVGYDYMGTIRTFRMFDQDIASTGLVSSTEPSLEPTLSLVFDGSGDSYIDFDWSE